MPTNGFSNKPLKVELLAGEQTATELWWCFETHLPRTDMGLVRREAAVAAVSAAVSEEAAAERAYLAPVVRCAARKVVDVRPNWGRPTAKF